jgi:hypothetical protein
LSAIVPTFYREKTMMNTKSTWYIAPVHDASDEYAAGYDGNAFASCEEAEAAIPSLAEAMDTDVAYWVACQREGDNSPRALRIRREQAEHIETETVWAYTLHGDLHVSVVVGEPAEVARRATQEEIEQSDAAGHEGWIETEVDVEIMRRLRGRGDL